jgi:hypothetical protein
MRMKSVPCFPKVLEFFFILYYDQKVHNFLFCWPCISIYACNETNLTYCLSSVCWVILPLQVSGLLVAHHQDVTMYICEICTCFTSQSTVGVLIQNTVDIETCRLLINWTFHGCCILKASGLINEVIWNVNMSSNCSSHVTSALWKIRPTSVYTDMYIYCSINDVSCYMFRPPFVVIFREVFFEGYIT